MRNSSDVCNVFSDGGVTIEYSNESPIFNQQLFAIDESISLLPSYLKSIATAFEDYNKAIAVIENVTNSLAIAISGSNGTYSRCLFSNSLPSLGDLTEVLKATSSVLQQSKEWNCTIRSNIEGTVIPRINQLLKENTPDNIRKLRKELDVKQSKYELLLDNALNTKKTVQISNKSIDKIINARIEYETSRYDIVTLINKSDIQKKSSLVSIMCSLYTSIAKSTNDMSKSILDNEDVFNSRISQLDEAEVIKGKNDVLYAAHRIKLIGEINGQSAPPGSPPTALCTIQPRSRHSMPIYTVPITTEIKSKGSREASYDELRHAAIDDGVYKQGYLFYTSGLLSGYKRYRRWYRLYCTKLYVLEIKNNETCSMETICDVVSSEIKAKLCDLPYTFAIVTKAGVKIELQAENEDEMVKWISALRRCGTGGASVRRRSASSTASSKNNDTLHTSSKSCILVQSNDKRADDLVSFVLRNQYCCECNSEAVSWISISLGVTVCDECALVHRQLTWAISKLKSIQLDEFTGWQIDLLLQMGNHLGNSIWEKNVPEGWMKLSRASPMEEKRDFIIAKYRWYGFVDEFCPIDDNQLSAGMIEAAASLDIGKIQYWLAQKANICCTYPIGSGRTPLHEAIEAIVTSDSSVANNSSICIVSYLLLNGADIYAVDHDGNTPVDMAKLHNHAGILAIIQSMQEGLY